MNQLVKLTITKKEKRWIFPEHKFFEFEVSDEWWAKKYSFGKEEEVEVTYTFPRVLIRGIRSDGTINFTAIPENFLC